jgi:hypothetical protein
MPKTEETQASDEAPDKYGNTEKDPLQFCCFPDCGCDGSRLCMAKSGPNQASYAINIEHRSHEVNPHTKHSHE